MRSVNLRVGLLNRVAPHIDVTAIEGLIGADLSGTGISRELSSVSGDVIAVEENCYVISEVES